MKLKVLSFSGENFSHNHALSVTVMTTGGEITLLDSHAPMMTSLEPCILYIKYLDENNMEQREDFAIGKGVLEVHYSEVKILSDMLIDIEEVDMDQASAAKERALELMEKYKHAKDRVDMEKFIEAEDMLMKSIAQLKLYDLKK
ncbi:ATP synthase F1 subunit epsilon [Candidatus Gracilibacteria bacterium]|nr:ATP synthase F1 subunit epsilon [Candidatus Gracilibacteria bacterium]